MEIQLAFNKAFAGVIAQGGLAKTAEGGCFYEMANGRRCGVGHLLTDEQLGVVRSVNMISAPVRWLVKDGVLDSSFGHPFFGELQAAHDDSDDLSDFKHKMLQLAEKFGLALPEGLSEADAIGGVL